MNVGNSKNRNTIFGLPHAVTAVAVGGALCLGIVVRAEMVIETVTVGNTGNAGELSGAGAGGVGPDRICGAVDYVYEIGKFEVTTGQYTEFLNAVAANDTYGLYNTTMWTCPFGCKIERSGLPGVYTYSVAAEWADRPVNGVSWADAARFCNWLHNGQPTGPQNRSTTEDGAYEMRLGPSVPRKVGARVFLPTEDEWYKAAYHKNDGTTGNYWDYPTQSNTVPLAEPPPGTEMIRGSANHNYAIDSPYYRTEAGAYDAKPSDSAYGTFDQSANLWEWIEAIQDGSNRGVRGGAFTERAVGQHANYRHFAESNEYTNVGFRVVLTPEPSLISTVTIGNPGNAPDIRYETPGYGAVDYVYDIGKSEVTAGQYTEFLNAVAATDTYGLYSTNMDVTVNGFGCNIVQTGSSGSYVYSVVPDWADRPVNFVSWGDASRFCNWLHNGQPNGAQGLDTTEDGSYLLNGAMDDTELSVVAREPDATWVIPSEDEWYKAAYHKNDGVTGDYWDYPTQSNTVPAAEAPPGTDMANGSADYYSGGYVDLVYYRTEATAYDAKPSDSAYDTFDQGGNVQEWNEAVIQGTYRGMRGGSFDIDGVYLHAANRSGTGPVSEDHSYGFRVARVSSVQPATASDDNAAFGKSRYISFIPGNAGQSTALRVTSTSLPSEFADHVGTHVWVGEPIEICENSGQGPEVAPGNCGPAWIGGPVLTMQTANLQSNRYCYDFGSVGPLHLTDCEIVPGATYTVAAIDCAADPDNETNYSAPLVISTSSWGNICGPYDPGNGRWSEPDTSVDIVFDVTACVDKFRNVFGAPLKPRADIDPNVPDGKINITSDVTRILDAFGGDPYPFAGPGTCPP